jgi:hypothetical protein
LAVSETFKKTANDEVIEIVNLQHLLIGIERL